AERIQRVWRSDIEPKELAVSINCLAEDVRRVQSQQIVQEPPVERRYQTMINRTATVGANRNTGLTQQTTVACRLVDEGHRWIVSAYLRRCSRRQEVGERRQIDAGTEP